MALSRWLCATAGGRSYRLTAGRLAYDIHLYKHYCLEISCGVKNILDQFQRDIDKGELRDASYIYGPSMPRTYFVGMSLKI